MCLFFSRNIFFFNFFFFFHFHFLCIPTYIRPSFYELLKHAHATIKMKCSPSHSHHTVWTQKTFKQTSDYGQIIASQPLQRFEWEKDRFNGHTHKIFHFYLEYNLKCECVTGIINIFTYYSSTDCAVLGFRWREPIKKCVCVFTCFASVEFS